MHAAVGILTTRGGMTSHAAVVARGMGRPCVSGAGEIRVDADKKTMVVKGQKVGEGDIITIDGGTGEVMIGKVPTIQPQLSGDFSKLMSWADKVRKLKVRTNAETPLDARTAREFGAEGIGLCRTEHMFFDGDAHRRDARDDHGRHGRRTGKRRWPRSCRCSARISSSCSRSCAGCPSPSACSIRRCTSSCPTRARRWRRSPRRAGVSADAVQARAAQLHESNPMLGHRGCRLGITYPEIYEMQARAIFEAAAAVHKEIGETVEAEIMIPLVSIPKELSLMKAVVEKVAAEVEKATGFKLPYLIGTMIELPRAALLAGEIAKDAQFFSFGTNDLTQTTYGLSRDDAARFINAYERQGIIKQDPFISLDPDGVGELVKIAAERGRKTRANAEARHLRRAWRRPGLDPFLRQGRPRLRLLLALPRADRQAGGGASRAGRHRRPQGRGLRLSPSAQSAILPV